jgi:cytochrome P450
VASAILLLNAGHEASVNALGGGVVALLRHPAGSPGCGRTAG